MKIAVITVVSAQHKSPIIVMVSRNTRSQSCPTDGKHEAQILKSLCCGHAGHLKLIKWHRPGGVELCREKSEEVHDIYAGFKAPTWTVLAMCLSQSGPIKLELHSQAECSRCLLWKGHLVQNCSPVGTKSRGGRNGQEIHSKTHSSSA